MGIAMQALHLSRLHQVAVHAQDLDASVAFYRDVLGARFVARFDPPGLAFFDLGGVRLLIERGATPATLYFHVDDIEAAVAALVARGVRMDSGPHCIHRDMDGTFGTAGEEEWMAFFRDPAGNTLALATRRPRR
jgi:methylmalonyl-CoA/ethylmalonyl-CoA epimerase